MDGNPIVSGTNRPGLATRKDSKRHRRKDGGKERESIDERLADTVWMEERRKRLALYCKANTKLEDVSDNGQNSIFKHD
jgi:hypothetical protein